MTGSSLRGRAALAAGSAETRRRFWMNVRGGLESETWEDLCRKSVAMASQENPVTGMGPWDPAGRWWRGQDPEWDLVARSTDGRRLLLAEVKWATGNSGAGLAEKAAAALAQKGIPPISEAANVEIVRAVFVPKCVAKPRSSSGVFVVDAEQVVESLAHER